MDNTTISLNLENLNDDERKLLMSLVEKGNKPKSKAWKPAHGQTVYVLTADNKAGTLRYNDRCNHYDRMAYEIGNIFPTNEAAEEEAKRRKILKRWKDLSIESGEEENPWDNKHMHYSVFYNCMKKTTEIFITDDTKRDSVYFATEKSLRAAIKEIGEENIKKYMFNIKE
jgi:hypothetical protein